MRRIRKHLIGLSCIKLCMILMEVLRGLIVKYVLDRSIQIIKGVIRNLKMFFADSGKQMRVAPYRKYQSFRISSIIQDLNYFLRLFFTKAMEQTTNFIIFQLNMHLYQCLRFQQSQPWIYNYYLTETMNNQPPTPELRSKKKILINLQRKPAKATKLWHFSQDHLTPDQTQSGDLPKLLSISERCQSYFEKFETLHAKQMRQTELLFAQLEQVLEETFLQIFQAIEAHKDDLKFKIEKKKQELLISIQGHQQTLQQSIHQIIQKEMYFTAAKDPENQIQSTCLAQFATLLNQFYERYEQIEKIDFQEEVRSSCKRLEQKIRSQALVYGEKKNDGSNVTISFNNGHLFSGKQEEGGIEDLKKAINEEQIHRSQSIQNYLQRLAKTEQIMTF